ncbi:MAG TPA: hypothetical protein VLM38_15865 [Blastocatellia bacterium]|nr:hypothetical protein [Blastocatellia bacterium]
MRNVFLIVVTLSLMAIAGRIPAHAQVIDALEADIPFGFTVRNTTLPAGEYTIKRVNSRDDVVMEIRSADGQSRMVFMVESAQTAKAPARPELIFDRVGDRYFLSEIFEEGSTIGVELPKSHAERKLEKEGAMVQVHSVTVPGVLNAAR